MVKVAVAGLYWFHRQFPGRGNPKNPINPISTMFSATMSAQFDAHFVCKTLGLLGLLGFLGPPQDSRLGQTELNKPNIRLLLFVGYLTALLF